MGAFKWVQQFLGVYERMSVRAKEPRDYKLLMQLSLKKMHYRIKKRQINCIL